MSWIPNIPVPGVDSASNVYFSDVVGNKSDDENGTSLYSRGFKTDTHVHSAAKVYPSMTTGATVTKSATAWTLGALSVVIPSNAIADQFDIHGINYDSVPDNGVYEIVLYAGPSGSQVEIGRTRFARTEAADIELESPFMTQIQAANTEIWAALAGSNTSATAAVISLRYHTY
jgi:hypothetical protein